MEKSGSGNIQNALKVVWETPGEKDLSDSILKDFKREYEECESALTPIFSYQKTVKLQDIKNRVGLMISQRRLSQESGDAPINERSLLRLDDERIDQLYSDLVQTFVLKAIQEIEKISLATLDKVLSKITFRENIEELEDKLVGFSTFDKKDGGNIHDYLLQNSTGLKPVIEPKENEQIMMKVANDFMEAFHSMISFPYIKMQFIIQGFEEFIDSLEEIVQKAEDLLVTKFIKAQNKLHTNFTKIAATILESFKVTVEKGVEDEISLSQQGNYQEAQQRHQNLKKNLQIEYSTLLGQYFHAGIFPPLFKPFFTQIDDQTDQQFNDLLLQKKLAQKSILKQNFEEIMFSVVEKEITRKQFQYLSQKDAQNAFCFVLSHISLQGSTSPTIQLFTSLVEYLTSLLLIPEDPLVEQSKMYLINYEINNADSSEFKDYLNRNKLLFIQYLEKCEYGQAELVLVQIYLAISNIRIDHQYKNVKIGPFFGCLFDLRYQIANSLETVSSLKTKGLGQFFAFLDCYFESKLIYQLGQYSDNIFEKAGMKIIIQDDQQDYNLLITLRQTITEQSPQHEKQVIQEFHQAALSIKEKTKEIMPNQFYLKKVSDSYVRSRSIVIAASGFTSKEEDKQIKWAKIADHLPECEVYAVQYDSKTPGDLRTFIEASVASFFVPSVSSLVGGLVGKLGKVIAPSNEVASKNPYQQAVEEACQTGIYLAHLLFEGNLFPNCTISFIGFSLGTQVISSCLQEYNKMLQISMKPSIVMSVAFLGGAADITDIKTSNLINIISHRLFNCYSSKDGVLRYTLRLVYFFSKPLGLSSITGLIPNQQKKILNFDLSSKIPKHLAYMKQIQDILTQIGFPYLL